MYYALSLYPEQLVGLKQNSVMSWSVMIFGSWKTRRRIFWSTQGLTKYRTGMRVTIHEKRRKRDRAPPQKKEDKIVFPIFLYPESEEKEENQDPKKIQLKNYIIRVRLYVYLNTLLSCIL